MYPGSSLVITCAVLTVAGTSSISRPTNDHTAVKVLDTGIR